MLPLKALLQATPAKIKKRSRDQCFGRSYAPPRRKKARHSLTKGMGYLVDDETGKYREFKYRTRCTDGWRRVAVRFYGPLNPNTRVWCWCDCPYFKYNCEVALASKGSSSVVQSNGQRPRFTNPRLEPRVCKHVYLVFALALRRREPDQKLMGSVNQPKGRTKKRQTARSIWAGDQLRGPKSPVRVKVPEN